MQQYQSQNVSIQILVYILIDGIFGGMWYLGLLVFVQEKKENAVQKLFIYKKKKKEN